MLTLRPCAFWVGGRTPDRGWLCAPPISVRTLDGGNQSYPKGKYDNATKASPRLMELFSNQTWSDGRSLDGRHWSELFIGRLVFRSSRASVSLCSTPRGISARSGFPERASEWNRLPAATILFTPAARPVARWVMLSSTLTVCWAPFL